MNGAVLVTYDIPDSLKIANPSARFRRHGFRVNLSCWVFPQHLLPGDEIAALRDAGATVHMIEFAEKDFEKILELARQELRRHAKKIMETVQAKCIAIKDSLGFCWPERGAFSYSYPEPMDDSEARKRKKFYRKWRSELSKGRRELLAAEQCAFGFAISRDVEEALSGLKSVLASELSLALSWRDSQKEMVAA